MKTSSKRIINQETRKGCGSNDYLRRKMKQNVKIALYNVLYVGILIVIAQLALSNSLQYVNENMEQALPDGRTYIDNSVQCDESQCFKMVKVCGKKERKEEKECKEKKEIFQKEYSDNPMTCTLFKCYKEVEYCSTYTKECEQGKEIIK